VRTKNKLEIQTSGTYAKVIEVIWTWPLLTGSIATKKKQKGQNTYLDLRKEMQVSWSWSITSRELELGHYMQARKSKHRVQK